LLIFWLGRRFPLEQRRWLRNGLIHLLASAVVAVLDITITVALSQILRRQITKPTISFPILQYYCLVKFHACVFYYWVILGVGHAIQNYRKFRDRELQASKLKAQLVQAQLDVLKMQLHPHFLFNTLHAISALVHQDVELADRMIARLGDLLRSTLENRNMHEVSVREELEYIQPYLEIEQARIGSRLQVRMEVEPGIMDAWVPNMILQPLVENAIRHGVAPRPETGCVAIRVRRDAKTLRLEVQDDGPGLPDEQASPFKEGLGLANTRARLLQLYGEGHRFELANGGGRGLVVRIELPYRETAGASWAEDGHEDSDVGRR
jgi:LytS/YehU family sensor histidine kinase